MKNLTEIKRALIVRPDEIGDVVLSSAFLRELRHNLPKAWICLVVKPAVYNLVEYSPYINELVTYDWTSRRYLGRLQGSWRAFQFARRKLRRLHFDLAVVPRYDADYYHATYIAYFSRAARRVGYSETTTADKRRWNRSYNRLLTEVIRNDEPKHEVQRSLDVIRFLGGEVRDDRIELWLRPEDELFAQRLFDLERVQPQERVIALGVGTRHPKRWPLENFIALGKWLLHEYHARLIVLGDDKDSFLGNELLHRLGDSVINLAGHSTLRETAATLKRCHLYVGNDTGPVHMAAAVGIPVCVVSCHPLSGAADHSNSPSRFGPWQAPHKVVQPEKPMAPCVTACTLKEAHCIRQVSVDAVKAAVAELLVRQ